jgi:hypothetical protein
MYDIVVLTQAEYINPKKVYWYVQQVLDEDNYLLDAFAAHGLNVCKKDWSDPKYWDVERFISFLYQPKQR